MTPRLTPRPTKLTFYRRRVVAVALLATVLYLGYLGVTLVQALTNPSYGVSLSARGAEWGREHGLGSVVTWVEKEIYSLSPPKTGGSVSDHAFGAGSNTLHIPASGHLPVPAPLVSPVAHPLPGEGAWHPVGRFTAKGVPAVYEAFVRPDAVHTSFVVGVAWMDTTLLRGQLYSGSFIPGGGPFTHSAPIRPADSRSLVAAFNAGFRMEDANAGYYTDHRTIVPLRRGAASVVFYKSGVVTVAKWGRDATMSANVVAVRQNLDLIVDNGQPVAGLNAADATKWGKTLGGGFLVWRSGLGVTRNGALVYVGGPSLSIGSLADLLVRAGAVRGMEMDINTDWVQFSVYHGALGQVINGGAGTPLLSGVNGAPANSQMDGPASRYFTTWWNRDFITMSLR